MWHFFPDWLTYYKHSKKLSSIPGFDKLSQHSQEEKVLENSKSENVDNSINIANSIEHNVIEESSKGIVPTFWLL